jgi:hypothetical protein
MFSTYTLDTLSQATLSIWAAQSSASLTKTAVISHAVVAS